MTVNLQSRAGRRRRLLPPILPVVVVVRPSGGAGGTGGADSRLARSLLIRRASPPSPPPPSSATFSSSARQFSGGSGKPGTGGREVVVVAGKGSGGRRGEETGGGGGSTKTAADDVGGGGRGAGPTTPLPAAAEGEAAANGGPRSARERAARLSAALAEGVGQRLSLPKMKIEEWRLSDLVSVYGVATLFLAVLLIPIMVEQMKASDRHYDEVEVEDAIRRALLDVARDIDREILKYVGGRGGGNRDPQGEGAEGRAGGGVAEGGLAAGVAADVVSQVLASDALRESASNLASAVVQSPQFQSALGSLVKKLWRDLVDDPDTTNQLLGLLRNVFGNPETREAAKRLVLELVNDDEVYREVMDLIVRMGGDLSDETS